MGACLSSPSLTSRFGLDGVYVVDRLLARGGQGTVWLAHPADTADADKDVALKCTQRGSLSHQFAAQLAHEIQLTLFLGASHVHVARPRELLVTSSHLVLAMRFSPGGTLEALARNRSVGEAEAQYYVSQLVSALEYCHSVGVAWCASHRPNESDVAWAVLGNANSCARCTHRRDVKLANVLLDEHDPPWAQLCDWGVARRLSDDAAPKAFADAPPLRTTLVGTPGFLSPEVLDIAFNPQCVGYDAKAADVWSLGAAAHALVRRGAPPYAFDEAAARGGVKGAMRGCGRPRGAAWRGMMRRRARARASRRTWPAFWVPPWRRAPLTGRACVTWLLIRGCCARCRHISRVRARNRPPPRRASPSAPRSAPCATRTRPSRAR